MLLQQLGRIDEALSYFDKAIQLNPTNENTFNNKG